MKKKSTKKVLKAYMDAIAGYLKCIADDVANEEKRRQESKKRQSMNY